MEALFRMEAVIRALLVNRFFSLNGVVRYKPICCIAYLYSSPKNSVIRDLDYTILSENIL